MHIVVPIKQVPDLVEELEIDGSGAALDRAAVKWKPNEFDEHAVEEALQLKEQGGHTVTVIALDAGDVDETLFTCLAKGANRAVKVTGDFPNGADSHTAARLLAEAIRQLDCQLVLTGVQAVDDVDGQVSGLLAAHLGVPHVGVVTGITIDGGAATVRKEFAGGVIGEFEVELPAVLGVQAARVPPRYAPISRIRQMMKTGKLDEAAAGDGGGGAGITVLRLYKPEAGSRAEMIEGGADEIAERIAAILGEKGLLKR